MTTTRRSLRSLLRGDDPLVLTLSVIPSSTIAELIGLAGFDGIVFDMEHGPFTASSVADCMAAAEARNLFPLVRIPFDRHAEIGALLDLGIRGVIVPHIESPSQASVIAEVCRFRPAGSRGANGWVRAAGFGGDPKYFADENERVGVIVQIEGRAGLAEAEAIIATPGIDAVFVGPVDLSHSLGVANDLEHPLIIDAVATVVAYARAEQKAVCIFSPSTEQALRWRGRGVQVSILGVDAALILRSLSAEYAAMDT